MIVGGVGEDDAQNLCRRHSSVCSCVVNYAGECERSDDGYWTVNYGLEH